MKRMMMALALAAMGLSEAVAQTVAWPEVKREAKPGLRWWWLGSAVDQENLKWNMEQFAQAGVGNLEITPIYGVKGNASKNISFLSTNWLDMLKYTKQMGEQLDIDIDMTTGTGWPFGGPMVKTTESASKLVTEVKDVTGDGTTAQTLTLTTSGATLQKVMAYPQKDNGGEVTDLTALVDGKTLTWTAPTGKWKVIAAYNQYGVMQVKRPSPGSEGNVLDYFDATAVANYLSYFDAKFEAGGNPWPHTFFNDSYEINQADWTPKMFEQFEQRRGYRLQDNLDLLLGQGNRTATQTKAQVTADYRQTLSDMLRDNFTRQWTQWAHSHGATTRNQAHGSPGNLIDLYAEADIPETENFYLNSFGIKGLRDDAGFYNKALSTRATLKYASSAAHITGKPLASSESMTWLTEHFRTSLSQIKPELDLLFTSGVNHVLFHGAAYSPREAAWPGWKFYAAIDMSPTNSIWHDAPSMMKYIERVQSFMQTGQPDNDVLVYAPFANTMRKTTGTWANRMLLFDINTMSTKMSELEQCVNNLEKQGLDCDYTSEQFLMTTTFTDGMLQTAAGTRYKALVVPVADNMPDSIKTHIEGLKALGAQVVTGRTASELAVLTAGTETLRSEMGLSVIRRKDTAGYHYFIANLTANDVEGYAALSVPFTSIAFFDPMTGAVAKGHVTDGKVWVSLKSGQSTILQTYDSDIALEQENAPVQEMGVIAIDGPWTLSFADSEPSVTESYQLDKVQTWETLDAQTARLMGTGTYETSFSLTAQQLSTATGGFLLSLGDVRESARVWLNGDYLGCAWAAPFVLNCGQSVKEGTNTLKIEVTNLPANRIRQMDIDGTVWRIFEDANINTISGSSTFDKWALVPSGLNSSVSLIPLAGEQNALVLTPRGMVQETDGNYYAEYAISLPGGQAVKTVAMTDQGGAAFTDFTTQEGADGMTLLTVKGVLADDAVVVVTDADGGAHYSYVPAFGAYQQLMTLDFTAEPGAQWDQMKTQIAINGFSGQGKLDWYRSKTSAKETAFYDGLTFTSEKSTYYFYFVGYGFNAPNDFSVVVNDAKLGDVCIVGYLKGEGNSTYHAADSLLAIASCTDESQGLNMALAGNSSYQIYRSLTVYRPTTDLTAVQTLVVPVANEEACYTLQGQRVARPGKGIYVKKGKKIVYK